MYACSKWIGRAAGLWLCNLALFGFTLHCNDALLYHPSPQILTDPAQLGYRYEDVWIEGYEDVRLHAWRFLADPGAGKTKAIVLHFHGNAENVSTHSLTLAWLTDYGYELLSADYRGYGKSEGLPDDYGIYRDSFFVIGHALEEARKRDLPLFVYGQSLGSAVALRAVGELSPQERTGIRAIVVEGGFPSYSSAAQAIGARSCATPIGWLGAALITDSYGPEDFIDRIAPLPLLVIHGENDHVIPLELGRAVYEQAREPKAWLRIPEGGHLNWLRPKAFMYRTELLAFLKNPLQFSEVDDASTAGRSFILP